jgi:hypothetical protein
MNKIPPPVKKSRSKNCVSPVIIDLDQALWVNEFMEALNVALEITGQKVGQSK